MFRPSTAGDEALPLVMVLHGGFGSGEHAERAYRWDALGERAGFMTCHPDGLMRAWNAGSCCGEPMRRNVDDVGFLTTLIDRLVGDGLADAARIYVTGMSNGAMMAYRLAVELPGRLAAIGPVAGTMTVPIDGAAPLSVCHIHGLDDFHVPFAGGTGSQAFARDWRRAVPEVIEEWRRLGGCGPARTWDRGPVRIDSASSDAGIEVALVTVRDAGHQWPGAPDVPPRVLRALRLDPPTRALDATATLWSFFAGHEVRSGARV